MSKKVNCKWCGVVFFSASNKKFCSNNCRLLKTKQNYKKNQLKRKEKLAISLQIGYYDDIPIIDYHYNLYKKQSLSRGINFSLSLEQYTSFWTKPCSYCNDLIETIGIDRIVNSIGYEFDNCIPCCTECNKMKRHHSTEWFINQCKKIATNQLKL